MEEQWHLVRNGNQSGPHSFKELQQLLQGVDPGREQVLVWTERLTEWTDPRKVAGLLEAPAQAPSAAAAPVAAAPARIPASGQGQGQGQGQAPVQNKPDLSSLNPYETPRSSLSRPAVAAVAAPGELGNHPLDVGACIQTGWKLTTSHFGKLILFGLAYIGLIILLMIPLGVLEGILGAKQDGSSPDGLAVLVTVVSQVLQNVVSIFLGIGATLFGLGMVRRTNPSIGVLFAGGPHFWSVFGASILMGLAVLLGIVLLVIPGIFLAVRLSQFQFAIIDQKLGPIDGLRASWEITKGNFWNLFLLGLANFGIVILGALALGVGLLWAYPTVILATVAAYFCMSRGPGSLPQWA